MVAKDLKSTKGITLISLVVSIVVLLILVGVSIVTLTGDNRDIISNPTCINSIGNSKSRGISKFRINK